MSLFIKKLYNNKYQNSFLLLFYAFIICIRNINIWIDGRFWTEESIFFFVAWVAPPITALLYPFGGYLNLATNTSSVIARWVVPLEYAPYVTTFIGLLFLLFPIFLLLTAKDEWLLSFKNRLFATLLFLFVPESFEISLQSLHLQFYLVLCVAIILILQTDRSFLRWFKLFVILLSALSGLMAFILLPLYAFKSFIDKNRLRYEQFIVLLIGCLIQYIFFYTKYTERAYHVSLSDFLSILGIRELIIPFIGYNSITNSYMNNALTLTQQGNHLLLFPCILGLLFILLICFCYYRYQSIRPSLVLFITSLLLLALSIFGALGDIGWFYLPHANQRYVCISQSLFSLMLLYFSYYLPPKGRILCNIMIVWLIIVGCFNFYSYTYPTNNVPAWRTQVALWRKNPSYMLHAWGGDIWKIPLSPHKP